MADLERIEDVVVRASCEKKCLLMAREMVLASSAEHSLEGLSVFLCMIMIMMMMMLVIVMMMMVTIVVIMMIIIIVLINIPPLPSPSPPASLPRLLSSLLLSPLLLPLFLVFSPSPGLYDIHGLVMKARGYYAQDSSPVKWSGDV